MNRLHPRIKPSAGAGLGKALVEAHLDSDPTALAGALRSFTIDEALSSLWETMVWVSAHCRVHGSIERIDALYAGAEARIVGDGAEHVWAREFLETFDEALQHDAEALPALRRPSRRPMVGRPIFTTWLAVQEANGPFGNTVRPYAGFDGPRCAFTVTVVEQGEGMVEGAIAAVAAIATSLAAEEGVPVTLLLSVVNAVTLMRGARGDYAAVDRRVS